MDEMPLVFGKEFSAGDGVGVVFFDVDGAVNQIDEEPVKRTHSGKEPGIVSRKKPAKCKDTQGPDGCDMPPANNSESTQQSFLSHLAPILAFANREAQVIRVLLAGENI